MCERFGIAPKGASPEFWDVVVAYKWPGNVRELIQALEKALLSAKDEPMLFPKHLPTYIRIQVARNAFPRKPAGPGHAPEPRPDAFPRRRPNGKRSGKPPSPKPSRRYLKDLISYAGGDINKACRISGLSRSRFYTLLRKNRPADER